MINLCDIQNNGNSHTSNRKKRTMFILESSVIPIVPALKKVLMELQATSVDEFVFPRIKGWMQNNESMCLKLFLKSVGIREVNFYSFRGTWAIAHLEIGTPLHAIMQFAGWHSMHGLSKYMRMCSVQIEKSVADFKY